MKMKPQDTKKVERTVDQLLKLKRQERPRPSDTYWRLDFEPGLMRKLMQKVSRPRHTGRALTVAGWLSPLVFAGVVALALGVAYMFSPQRAIARWEAETTGREYVTDSLRSNSKAGGYRVADGRGGEYILTSQDMGEVASYEFQPALSSKSQF